MPDESKYRDRSVLIHGKFRSEKWDFRDHLLPPITTASAFRLRSAERGAQGFLQYANPDVDRANTPPIYIYDRLDEPCNGLLEETLAFAERGECAITYSTGVAAIAAAIGIHTRAGDHICYHPAIYGCTHSHICNWLTRYDIGHTAVRFSDLDALEQAIQPSTRVLYFETPANPTLELVDLAAVAELAASVNDDRPEEERLVTIVDNTFASPYGQRPLEHGIDFVLHSLTKHIGGFGATMGGAVIGPTSAETDLLLYRKDFGGFLAPDSAWHILAYGLPSLPTRLDRQQQTALVVARFLEGHPAVERVVYPGLESFPQKDLARRQMVTAEGEFAPGAMVYFTLKGDDEAAYRSAAKVCDHVAENALSVTLAVSLGQIRSLIEHPASMTHAPIPPEEQAKGGITRGGVRLSIGLEDERDIVADLDAALAQVQ